MYPAYTIAAMNSSEIIELIGAATGSSGRPGGGGFAD